MYEKYSNLPASNRVFCFLTNLTLREARGDNGEHNELRRVVNSLLLFIDRMRPKGFLIAATNLDQSLDPAVWRRFDEVVWFEKPDKEMINRFLSLSLKNVPTSFDPTTWSLCLRAIHTQRLSEFALRLSSR